MVMAWQRNSAGINNGWHGVSKASMAAGVAKWRKPAINGVINNAGGESENGMAWRRKRGGYYRGGWRNIMAALMKAMAKIMAMRLMAKISMAKSAMAAASANRLA